MGLIGNIFMLNKGRPLDVAERDLFKPYFQPRTLHKVRIIEGRAPFWLSKKMCAVVLGTRIYFRAGSYQFNAQHCIELLAHELTHVEQYLSGMTVLKYLWASRQGYRENPYEVEAYAKGAYVRVQVLLNQRVQ
jgi:hypothetical protein